MTRVVIVGAGMVGAACAAELAGEVDLIVIEGATPAGGATAACMGHVVVMDDSQAQFELTHHSQRLWDELELPAGVERERCGTLWLAEDDEELEAARAKCTFYEERGVPAEMIDAPTLRRAEPQLRPDLIGALRVPGDSVVYPAAAVAHLLALAARRSEEASRHFELRLGQPVVSIDKGPQASTAPRTSTVKLKDGTGLEADQVLVTAGLTSLDIFDLGDLEVAIRPRKGHLVITDRRPAFCRHQLVELGYLKSAHGGAQTSVAFNLQPRLTGQMLIGSSRQTDVASRHVEPEIVGRMLRRAAHFLPRLGELQAIRVWTGVRPATDDHLPYIGPVNDSICLAAGHEGLGITTATGTAQLVAHHVLGRSTELDPRPFLPTRAKT